MAKIVVFRTEDWPYVDYCGVEDELLDTTRQPREVEIPDELYIATVQAEADYAHVMSDLRDHWLTGTPLENR